MKIEEIEKGARLFMRYDGGLPCIEVTVLALPGEEKNSPSGIKVHWEIGGISITSPEKLFPTREECMKYHYEYERIQTENYKKRITDLDSLISFCIEK